MDAQPVNLTIYEGGSLIVPFGATDAETGEFISLRDCNIRSAFRVNLDDPTAVFELSLENGDFFFENDDPDTGLFYMNISQVHVSSVDFTKIKRAEYDVFIDWPDGESRPEFEGTALFKRTNTRSV